MADGRPFDLLEAADGSAVILLFVPADPATLVRTYAAVAASLADRIAAAAVRVFIIAPRRSGVGWPEPPCPSSQDRESEVCTRSDPASPGTAPPADATTPLLDENGGFAYSLGLADWDDEIGRAELERPVGLVLDDVGAVVMAEHGERLDLGRLVASLPTAGTADPGRARRQ